MPPPGGWECCVDVVCLLAAARLAAALDITFGIFLGEGAGVDSDEDDESSSDEFLLVFLIAFVLFVVVFFSKVLFTGFRTAVDFLRLSFFSAEGFSFLTLSSLELELLEEPEPLDADPLSLSLELSEPRSEPLEDPLDDPLELESDVSSIF